MPPFADSVKPPALSILKTGAALSTIDAGSVAMRHAAAVLNTIAASTERVAEQLSSELDLNGEASAYTEAVSQQRAFRLPLEAVSLVPEHEY